MSNRERRIQRLFFEGVDLPEDELDAFLDAECGDDGELRAAVEALLRPSESGGSYLATPAVEDIAAGLEPAHDRIGRFRVVGVLGQGGMGTVYRARQENPRREVALKVIRFESQSSATRKRFEREAEILGRLKHPGIAQIYEAGHTDPPAEDPFFAMELVDGLPLGDFVRKNDYDAAARLELMACIADAVHHAHERGVVHRDLKPGNILIEEGGRPKILDFGIARLTDLDLHTISPTRTGELVGTLAYMSPEQVRGESRCIDRRSDVYSLGVVLYELLSNQLPVEVTGCSVPEVARRIADVEPQRLGAIDPALRGDVETIVAKAIEKVRERRYGSAAELASDLRRFLKNEPIVARPVSSIYQLRKFVSRHRALFVGAAVAVLSLVAGIFVTMLLTSKEPVDAASKTEGAQAGGEGIDGGHPSAAPPAAPRRPQRIGQDDCADAPLDLVVGSGEFPFDNTHASTGSEGQTECSKFNTTGMEKDLWFTYVATVNGRVLIATCEAPGTNKDTKLVAFASLGCPEPGSFIACSDVTITCTGPFPNGPHAKVGFDVVAGMHYTIQVASHPGVGARGTGTITITESQLGSDWDAPYVNPVNGHHYEVVPFAPQAWSAAVAQAAAMARGNEPGHLATITEPSEQVFVRALVELTGVENPWIGLYQSPNGTPACEPAACWRWITGEPFVYAGWRSYEPDDAGRIEHWAMMGRDGWADQRDGDPVARGFIVEYD
ncbi:MAG: protein kinase [bacterium]|nr:protein kinase [bacterium]